MGGDRALRVEENLGSGFVRLRVAEAERRQAAHDIRCSEDVIIELLRNARDAGARRIYVATAREGGTRTITMLDDGSGIPRELWEAIFDARVTSKLESVHMDRWGVHGRGMALYSIRENVTSARVADSVVGGGSSICVTTDTTSLSERADQSSWPTVGRDDEGHLVVERGPHNMIRTCCEFGLEERGSCEVFIGSPAEIVATARTRVKTSLHGADLIFLDDLSTVAPLERFRLASDARELADVAHGLGLDISERTAHRIMAGQIRPLRSVVARLTHKGAASHQREVNLSADQRGLRISKDDSEEFLRMMERDFSYLAERYYLSLSGPVKMRVRGNRLSILFEYEGED
jgi:hypothetical protein